MVSFSLCGVANPKSPPYGISDFHVMCILLLFYPIHFCSMIGIRKSHRIDWQTDTESRKMGEVKEKIEKYIKGIYDPAVGTCQSR